MIQIPNPMDARGAAMLELAIIMSSLFMLITMPFQFCEALHYRERLSNIAQETSSLAFRECSPKVKDQGALIGCLKAIQSTAKDIAEKQFPNTEDRWIVINAFKYDAENENYPVASSWGWLGDCSMFNFSCKAKVRGIKFENEFNRQHDPANPSVLADQKLLFITEIQVVPKSTLSQIPGLNTFYEIGVY